MFRKLIVAAFLGLFCTTTAQADDEKQADDKKAKLFERIDANSDGKITKAEFEKFFDTLATKAKDAGKGGKLGDKLGGLSVKAFEKLDTNKDGVLTKAEFEKAGGNLDAEKLKMLLKKKVGPQE